MSLRRFGSFFTLILALTFQLEAQIPRTISYQGVLTDPTGRVKKDSIYSFKFAFYNAQSAGTVLWTKDTSLSVIRGLFYLVFSSFPNTLKFDKPYWLGVKVQPDPELQPRIELTGVPYAMASFRADTAKFAIAANVLRPISPGISTADIVDKAVTAAKIDTSGLKVAAIIPDNSIDSTKIKDGSITTADLKPNAVTAAKIDTSGLRVAAVIPDNSIDSTKIKDGSITTVDIRDKAVTAAKIDTTGLRVTTIASVADNSIDSTKIKDGSITTADIRSNAITAAKIDTTGLRVTAFIADNSVTSSKILDGTIVGADIANATIGIGNLNFTPLTSIAQNSITSGHIVDLEIVNADINPSANIAPSKIAGTAITGTGGTITGNTSSPMLSITNSGSGYGIYSGSNSSHGIYGQGGLAAGKAGVYGENMGSGNGLTGFSSSGRGVYGISSSGYAGFFEISNLSNALPAVYVESNGTSTAATFKVTNASNASPPLQVYSNNASANVNLVEGFVGSTRKFSITNTGLYNGPGDFAEAMIVAGLSTDYETGDVLTLSETTEETVEKSSIACSPKVMGVYSTEPGFLGFSGSDRTLRSNQIPVAIVGIVPCKVSTENGSIHIGDLLTTSNTPGHAMKATEPKLGTILGKALEALSTGKGKIKILVTLH